MHERLLKLFSKLTQSIVAAAREDGAQFSAHKLYLTGVVCVVLMIAENEAVSASFLMKFNVELKVCCL